MDPQKRNIVQALLASLNPGMLMDEMSLQNGPANPSPLRQRQTQAQMEKFAREREAMQIDPQEYMRNYARDAEDMAAQRQYAPGMGPTPADSMTRDQAFDQTKAQIQQLIAQGMSPDDAIAEVIGVQPSQGPRSSATPAQPQVQPQFNPADDMALQEQMWNLMSPSQRQAVMEYVAQGAPIDQALDAVADSNRTGGASYNMNAITRGR
jgi:hypothetical protein